MIYERKKQKVQTIANKSKYIQVVSDGSANIARVRVENTSFLVDGISYYWRLVGIGAIKAGASWSFENVISNAREITNNQLVQWNSFSSDTCSTQRATWNQLIVNPETSHIHCIPCDSHSNHLIFKDLLFPRVDSSKAIIKTYMGDFFKDGPNEIVSTFNKSNKQLAYLQSCMMVIYKKLKALIATAPTRWGTQYNQLNSIVNSEEALKAYSLHPDTNIKLCGIIQEVEFWSTLYSLRIFLKPLHEHQKMSESNAATINKVYPC